MADTLVQRTGASSSESRVWDLSPTLTPAQAFAVAANHPRPFFLDSGPEDEAREAGRFSFVGHSPDVVVEAWDRTCLVQAGPARRRRLPADPFEVLRSVLRAARRGFRPAGVPVPFAGGFVGYFGYDLSRCLERLPRSARRDIDLPDLHFGHYSTMIVFDHRRGRVLLAGPPGPAVEKWRRALDDRREPSWLGGAPTPAAPFAPAAAKPIAGTPRADEPKTRYLAAVRRVKRYIEAGDVYQVNLARRFSAQTALSAPRLYERLRRSNPAPLAAYLGLPDAAVLSSSPERFLRVRDGVVESRPIKGTRPRGPTAGSDEAMRRALLASEKDQAELAMIVDLERNDLGRACEYGTVSAAWPPAVESYATVHHLVATVTGRLRPDVDAIDLVRAAFPGGSITGAPKIRAMEIIDELEPTRRSVYTGAIGYLGDDGSVDLNVAIRTLLYQRGRVWFHAGGGIVADSDPEAEYDETQAKAEGLRRALLEPIPIAHASPGGPRA